MFYAVTVVAKRDFSKIQALESAWKQASLADREEFVHRIGRKIREDTLKETKSLFSQSAVVTFPQTKSE